MRIYKFKDNTDGNYAFIIANSEKQASDKLKEITLLQFTFVESKSFNELNKAIVLMNSIVPF